MSPKLIPAKTFAEKTIDFYSSLKTPKGLPAGVEVLDPYTKSPTRELVAAFMKKYFSDTKERTLIIGINPGRLGGGATGVHFTDPKALREFCGIPNDLPPTREVSSQFIYEMIAAYGGVEDFYSNFFLTAASPLGLVKGGVNYNYYDDPKTQKAMAPFIYESIEASIKLGCRRDVAIVLGTGKNFQFLSKLNAEKKIFGKLYELEHPRFIMQYRRKRKEEYIKKYVELLRVI